MLRNRSFVLLAVTALVLAGCASGATPSAAAPSAAAASAAAASAASPSQQKLLVGFSVPAVDDYYGVVRDTFVKVAKEQGVSYVEGNGEGASDPTQQIARIQDMLAQGITVLAVAPPGDAFLPVLNKAVSSGVKVIFIDQQVPNFKDATTFIATNSPAGSQAMGDYLVKKLQPGDEVGIMIGIPGIPLLLDRYSNFKNTLEKAGIKVILSSEADGCQADTATNVARTFIVANPNLKAIYSTCGPTGIAVNAVLQEQGKKAMSLSWDVQVQEINDILAGRAEAAVAQFPQNLATNAVTYALKIAAGETVPTYIDNGTEIVTIANAATFFHEGTTGYSYKLSTP